MPVFEYRCARCGHVFEHFWRGVERREELRCPVCEADKVEKQVSRCASGTRTGGSSSLGGSGCAPSG